MLIYKYLSEVVVPAVNAAENAPDVLVPELATDVLRQIAYIRTSTFLAGTGRAWLSVAAAWQSSGKSDSIAQMVSDHLNHACGTLSIAPHHARCWLDQLLRVTTAGKKGQREFQISSRAITERPQPLFASHAATVAALTADAPVSRYLAYARFGNDPALARAYFSELKAAIAAETDTLLLHLGKKALAHAATKEGC